MLVLPAALLGACNSGNPKVSTSDLTPTTAGGPFTLPTPTVSPECARLFGTTARITINDGGLSPRCVIVTAAQKLQVKNTGKLFHSVQIEDLNANLSPGDTQYFDKLGKYLTPGTYLIWSWTESDPAVFPNFNGTLVLRSA
jgi:hypothetical protein